MSETVKKPKPSPKLRKTATAKDTVRKAAKKTIAPKQAAQKKPRAVVKSIDKKELAPTYEQIAELARRFWAERGYVDGHHEDDWFRAEQELRSKAS